MRGFMVNPKSKKDQTTSSSLNVQLPSTTLVRHLTSLSVFSYKCFSAYLFPHSPEREDALHKGGSAFWNSTTMNDDVVTGGHKLVHSPVNKHSRPEITVILPDQETVARSLYFDNLATETKFAPDTLQRGRTLETTAEAISRSAFPVLNPKVHSKNSEFAERISPAKSPPKVATKTSSLASTVLGSFHTKNTPNGKSLEPEPEPPIQQSQEQSRKDIPDQSEQASVPNTCDQEPKGEKAGHPTDEAISRRPKPIEGVEGTNDPGEVLDVDPRGETQCTVEENDSNGTTDVGAESNFHVVCETVLDLPAGTVSQHNQLTERQGYLGINPELWDHIQTQRGSILPSFARSGRPIHSFADIHNLTLYLRELRLLTPLESLTPEINLLLRKLDNFPGASRPNNVQLAEEIKPTLSQAKTQLKQLLSPDITGQISQQSVAPQQVPPLSRTTQPPIPVRHTVHRPLRQPHNQPTNRHSLSPEQRSRRTAVVVANLDRLRAAFQHSLRLLNRET
ncbi:hypothetical protein OUZ56_033675 [Daphnia magna]|uniref:Uncharacterized protein n=1 Tax=Daphnia magna TaxID=35525 RepID=A0ABQ9ZZ02_9CRUS|nr:hypothetical protein OUZ56_033675 [Daphnia magna]